MHQKLIKELEKAVISNDDYLIQEIRQKLLDLDFKGEN